MKGTGWIPIIERIMKDKTVNLEVKDRQVNSEYMLEVEGWLEQLASYCILSVQKRKLLISLYNEKKIMLKST